MGLLAVLREMPGPSPALSEQLRSASPDRLVHEAATHGLAAVVWYELEAEGVRLPSKEHEELGRERLGTTAASLKVKALLLRVVDALAEKGIVPILLKGTALSERLYRDSLVRATSDVDLLVETADVATTTRVVEHLGMSLYEESEDYYPPKYRHHLAYRDRNGLVEVHFRAMSAFGVLVEADAWVARALPWRFEGRAVRLLVPEDELLYLALHAANHLFQRIAWLFDLKLFIAAHPAFEWDRFVAEARRTRLSDQVFFALDVARRAVGAQVPQRVLESLSPSALRRAIGSWAYSDEKLSASALHHDKRAWALAKLLLADSRPRFALFLARRVVWNIQKALQSQFRSRPRGHCP